MHFILAGYLRLFDPVTKHMQGSCHLAAISIDRFQFSVHPRSAGCFPHHSYDLAVDLDASWTNYCSPTCIILCCLKGKKAILSLWETLEYAADKVCVCISPAHLCVVGALNEPSIWSAHV